MDKSTHVSTSVNHAISTLISERELSELSGNNECGITGVLPVIISSFVLFCPCDLVHAHYTGMAFALRLLELRSGREK